MALRRSGESEPTDATVSLHPHTPPRFIVARRALLIAALTVVVDLAMVSSAYFATKAMRIDRIPNNLTLAHTDPVILATIPGWLLVFFVYGLYSRRQILEPSAKVTRVLSAVTVNIFLMVVVAFAFKIDLSRTWIVTLWVMSTVLVLAGRMLILRLAQHLNTTHWLGLRTLIVGTNGEARTLARVLGKKRYLGYEVLGFVGPMASGLDGIPIVGSVENIRETVVDQDVAAIFIAGSSAGPEVLSQIDAALTGLSVHIRTSLGLPHLAASRVVVQPVDGMAMLAVERLRPSESHLLIKRALDVTLAGLALILAAPVMIAIAILVRMSGEGPVIFAQKRVGTGGEHFTLYKFRTMVKDAERMRLELEDVNEAGGVLFKMRRDPRITPIGGHLRRLGLDELPQLFNILSGEMSLVGPRPALPSETENWSPEVAMRLRAKPGLTGLWQVSGRHELGFEDYVRYDLFYVENWSLGLDLRIIARTVPALLSRAGAY